MPGFAPFSPVEHNTKSAKVTVTDVVTGDGLGATTLKRSPAFFSALVTSSTP